jgi:hypothetical protein
MNAQQLGLQGQRHLADFVQKQRASSGFFEQAHVRRAGAGERAGLVSEELTFEELLRYRRAVHTDEWFVGAGECVHGLGDEFLARARRTLNQYRHVAKLRDPPHVLAQLACFLARPDQS